MFIPVSILFTGICYAQITNFDKISEAYNTSINQVKIELNKIDTSKISNYDKATWLYYNADYSFKKDNHDLAYKDISKAKKLFINEKADKDISDCNFLMLAIISHQNNLSLNKKQIQSIIDEEHKKALQKNDSTALRKVYYRLASAFMDGNNGEKAIEYFRKIMIIAKNQKDTLRIAYCLDNIGTVYSTIYNHPDSALYYAKKAMPFYIKLGNNRSLSYNYNNQAEQYRLQKKHAKALQYYKKADSIPLNEFRAKSKIIFYENISELYIEINDHKNAAIYLTKLNKLKDSINDTKQNIAISEIKEQYDNEKLRADNLESEAKRKQNQNIAIGLAGSLALGSIIAFLLFKNTKRKQKLAEQEKALETQKLATVLKDQEINSINAMIDGQEKERQRIANDLHDDLGGLMATVKLHFNRFKETQTPELLTTTNTLLDEAYNKVRSIAHAKNSGVIAKQGLLKAVKNMASKISKASNIEIEVSDFGLESRLENSLEITIFRIIQELTTNIIKHANASDVSISLTNHEDRLNIMIEDNGIGFNPKNVIKNDGMGLHSIEKRVEHLEGEMTIESAKNQGTTIIIDIPL